jgi:hypothetical membrane protein
VGRRTEAVGVACGVAGLAAFLAAWAISAAGDPEYVPFRDWISDLGVGGMAWLFNAGIALAGACIAVFAALGLRPVLGGGVLAHLAALLLCGVGALSVLAGVYTEDDMVAHNAASTALFVTIPFAGLSIWAALRRGDPLGRTVTELTKGTAVLVFILLVFLLNLNDAVAPVAETLLVMALVPWMLVVIVELGRRLWRGGRPSHAPPSAGPSNATPRRNADDAAHP